MFSFKSKLDDCNVSFKNYFLHEVAISGEGGDKGPNELLANGRMPLHETARNLNRHILRVVRHDAVLVGSAPRGVILDHERFDIIAGSKCNNARHREPSIEALRPRPWGSDYHATSSDAVLKNRNCAELPTIIVRYLSSGRIPSNKCMQTVVPRTRSISEADVSSLVSNVRELPRRLPAYRLGRVLEYIDDNLAACGHEPVAIPKLEVN